MDFFRRLFARNQQKDMQTVVMSVKDLKCHKCPDGYVYPPIERCKGGHLVCSGCLEQERCPICFSKLKIIHIDLEQIESVLQRCPNYVRGCKKRMPPDNMNFHENLCDFKVHVCNSLVGPKGCTWAGPRNELTAHMFGKHRAIISGGFKYDFVIKNYSQVTEFRATILMAAFHHLFLAKLEYDGVDEVFCGGVQFISVAPDVAPKFRYEFEIGKETLSRIAHYKFIFSRKLHTISEEYNNHTISDHFCFNKAIGNFFTDTNDTLKVTVVLKTVQSFAVKDDKTQQTYGFVPSQYCQRCVG